VKETDQVPVLDRQTRTCFSLKKFDGGGLILPFCPQKLDGAPGVCGAIVRGKNLRQLAAAQAIQ
jgi:hypothetical protein